MNLYLFAENLFIHELLHLVVAAVVSVIVYRKYRSKKLVITVFVVSFFIDADHLIEGFVLYGFNLFSWCQNIRGGFFRESGYMTVFFHSWELILLILFLGKKFNQWPLAVTIVLAAVGHTLIDQLVYSGLYGMSLFQYSFIYRALNHFSFIKLCGGC